ncbi:arylsulfatase [Inquilinus sp. CA228]|uniref:arylsulfatase n=1 Tax=Inquilinus sp. CA228 TaxID=3455609 RepID=UPI003F8D895C
MARLERRPVFIGLGWLAAVCLLASLSSVGAHAEQTGGIPDAPSPTMMIDGRHLPRPSPAFGGVIGLDAAHSTPSWPPNVAPPQGAPNVLLIITDDVGYGVPSTFGGVIPTPALDRIAKAGLRYTTFHSTALCSPTRAALITGRNHHSVGFGVVAELSTGYPGYDSTIGLENATIGEILKQNGYTTSWFGKDHNTPGWQYTLAGPFDQWPTGMGFEYFYGFLGGETDQWTPYLFRNTTQIFPWIGKPGYNLTGDLADEAITYLRQLNAAAPDKPFFLYYAPGGPHAPHQPPPEWIDKFKGRFDLGWNALREQIFANQRQLGVIPANARLTPWPDELPRWETLAAEEKRLFARQAEVFAAYASYTDHEIGRVVQAIDDLGRLDNTLVIYISGDNGASAEGSPIGTSNILASYQGVQVPVSEQMRLYDVWGSPQTYPHMAAAWSWAFDTPFKWTKQMASHFGGTRQGLAIAWPNHIKDAGGIRNQFHHVIDIVPTILEAAGIVSPTMVNGTAQTPIEGVSMAYTWPMENAGVPSRRRTQYFEMLGHRAIYHDGWIAATTPPAPPWAMGLARMPDVVDGYRWELYNVAEDYSADTDLADRMPDRLRRMQEQFLVEASRHDVFPLDNSVAQRLLAPRPSGAGGRAIFTYAGEISGIDPGSAPNLLNRSYVITAQVEVPPDGGNGMIVTQGGRFGGYGLYLRHGRPVFLYNFLNLERFRWEGPEALGPGGHTVVFDFTYDAPGFGKGGSGVLKVDGQTVASSRIPRTIPFLMPLGETFDIGADTRTPVADEDYQPPFRFSGRLVELTFGLRPMER